MLLHTVRSQSEREWLSSQLPSHSSSSPLEAHDIEMEGQRQASLPSSLAFWSFLYFHRASLTYYLIIPKPKNFPVRSKKLQNSGILHILL